MGVETVLVLCAVGVFLMAMSAVVPVQLNEFAWDHGRHSSDRNVRHKSSPGTTADISRIETSGTKASPARAESGSCPPTLPVDVCVARCGPQAPCGGAQLCCPTACAGAICVDPVTRRHFVSLVKQGRCPEYPRGAWICTHMCSGDADCPRALKCCTNRCGALTCQKPDPAYPRAEPVADPAYPSPQPVIDPATGYTESA